MEKAGLDPRTTASRPYRMACAGAIAAFVDSLADPNLEEKRVIVCALEPVSQHVSLDQCTMEDSALSLPAIFGDDFAAIAFNTSDFKIISPRTHIVYDGAPIRFHTDYPLPETEEGFVPAHYTFGERGKEISSFTKEGFFLEIQEPENGMRSQMDGWKTFKFFVPETIAVIKDVVERAQAQGINVEQAIMHQPSKKVNEGFQRQAGKTESLKGLRIPNFLLGEIRRSNSSSGTALVIWQYLAREGKLNPKEPFLVCAPGIGSAISAGVIFPIKSA
jgi:3-oxoacyl-[acyl-carrier-protein] synthase III